MQFTIQRLQHRLRIYEDQKVVEDEMEIVGVNQLEVGRVEEFEDETLPHPRDHKNYLKREQLSGQQQYKRPRERQDA